MPRIIINKTTDDASTRDWDNSRPLDVHSWSDYPEVNSFVDEIYSQYFSDITGNTRIAKKHIKKVLIDLYVAWVTDPNLNISVNMRKESYSNGIAVDQGRYNVLNIKTSTIKVIHRLIEVDLIGFKKGIQAQEGFERGFISRIWSTPKLIKMFEKVRFGIFDIGYNDSRLVLELNRTIKEKVNGKTNRTTELIEYDPDKLPRKVKKMEQVIKDYNNLLERTFIDIADAETYRVLIPATKKRKDKNKEVFVDVTHHSKFTHRVFNNGNWKQGGRFYGGFWQRMGSELRKKILIENQRTIEVDWSALHPILAYGTKGLEYDDKYPYDIPVNFVDELRINNPDVSKTIVKLLMLMALNASDEDSLFQAFRGEFYKSPEWQIIKNASTGFKITNEKLKIVLEDIKEKHSPIADMFNTKAALDLMYLDSRIVEYVIKKFTERDEPVLQIYDSFIVRQSEVQRLIDCMYDAFYEVTGKKIIQVKQLKDYVVTRTNVNAFKHMDFDYWYDNIQRAEPEYPETCEGYKRRFNRHFKHYIQRVPKQYVMNVNTEILNTSNKELYSAMCMKEWKKVQKKTQSN